MDWGIHETRRGRSFWRARLAALVAIAAAVVAGAMLDSNGANGQAEPGVVRPLGAVPSDARYVSPRGSNSNPGTRERPWRTLRKGLSAARPGDTVVLLPGAYGKRGRRVRIRRGGTASAPITVRREPGRRMPRILGMVEITASHLRLHELLFDGPTGSVQRPTEHNPRGQEVQI